MELSTLPIDPAVVERDIQQEVGNTVDQAKLLAADIKDDIMRGEAVKFGSIIQTKINRVKDKREAIVPPLRKAYEKVRDFFDDAVRPLEAAKRTLASAISAYDVEQERLRRIEQERVDAENRRKQQEYERQKKAWELEQAHDSAIKDHEEWERSAAADRFRQARDRKIKEEEDSRVEHAEAAIEQGNTDKVERILDKATPIVTPKAPEMPVARPELSRAISAPPPPPPAVPAPAIVARRPDENTLARDIWQWEGGDLRALAVAVAERRAPLEYLVFNNGVIGKDVRKLKDEFRCDGIRTWKERNTTFKAAKGDE